MAAEERWDGNFEAVRRFRDAHGRWPKQSEGALGTWCDTQRKAKKGQGGKRISPAQIAKLDGIRFDWGTTMAGTPEQRWNENFEEVRRFRDEHGRWPKKREGPLGRWCDRQRQAKKGKVTNRISPAQIAKLDGIGFDWGKTATAEATVEPDAIDPEPQQQKKAVLPRKRVHEADPEGRYSTRRAADPHAAPMAAAAAFWSAAPVVDAPNAGSAAAPSAGVPVTRERAGRKAPQQGTTSDDGDVIKSNF